MRLSIWIVADTVVEHGLAIGFAPTKKEAIAGICASFKGDKDKIAQLRRELGAFKPKTETTKTYSYFSVSRT